ncbi:hypothetical protein [Aquipuribacter sp. SD81]|uniref:hypothetical protein n=1 Tax=Aquipuribacter sp. SD81 TaxID=3127703 RepID=UPI003019AD5C
MIPRPDRLLADVVGSAADLVQTAVGLVGRADTLLTRIDALVARAEAVLARAESAAAAAESAVERVGAVTAHAQEQVDLVRRVTGKADRVASAASGAVQRGTALVDQVEPIAAEALPVARRLVGSIDTDEVDAAVAVVDRLPTVLAGLDGDLLPVMRRLEQVGPDVHALLETVDDLRRLVEGLPGMGLLRRRDDD